LGITEDHYFMIVGQHLFSNVYLNHKS